MPIAALTEREREKVREVLTLLGGALNDTTAPAPTLDALWAEYDLHVIPTLKAGACERSRARTVLGTVLADGRRIGVLPVTELIPAHADEYRVRRREQATRRTGRSHPASRNRELGRIAAALNWAVATERIPSNPWAKLKNEPEPRGRSTVVEPADFARYHQAAAPAFAAAVLLAYETGARRTEIFRLRWDNLDKRTQCLVLYADDTKTGQQRRIPVLAETWAWLMAQSRVCEWVFFNPATRKPWSAGWIHKRHREAVERAGLTAREGVWIHDLRASWITVTADTMSRPMRKRLSGHLTDANFARYDRVRVSDMDRAREQIATALSGHRKPPKRAPSKSPRQRKRNAP